jgi:hypothetical protein
MTAGVHPATGFGDWAGRPVPQQVLPRSLPFVKFDGRGDMGILVLVVATVETVEKPCRRRSGPISVSTGAVEEAVGRDARLCSE